VTYMGGGGPSAPVAASAAQGLPLMSLQPQSIPLPTPRPMR